MAASGAGGKVGASEDGEPTSGEVVGRSLARGWSFIGWSWQCCLRSCISSACPDYRTPNAPHKGVNAFTPKLTGFGPQPPSFLFLVFSVPTCTQAEILAR